MVCRHSHQHPPLTSSLLAPRSFPLLYGSPPHCRIYSVNSPYFQAYLRKSRAMAAALAAAKAATSGAQAPILPAGGARGIIIPTSA